MVSRKIKQLKKEREQLESELKEVTQYMAHLSISWVYKKCGNPKCKRCREEGRKHGPFLNVAYKERGKTRGFYVPVGYESLVKKAHRGWLKFKRIGDEIGRINREILRLELKEKQRRKKVRGREEEK